MSNNLRFYAFCNFYVGGIQAGIQTGHCATKMSSKYRNYSNTKIQKVFHDWEDNGVTIIILNGGTAIDIQNQYKSFYELSEKLGNYSIPYGYFAEEPGVLHPSNTCITCWGFILSPVVYESYLSNLRDNAIFKSSSIKSLEYLAAELIMDKSLAK